MSLPPLPIDDVLCALVAALRRSRAAVLRAPPGAGKTTRVPPAVLDSGLAESGRVLLLQPRRVAARAAARRIADERGAPIGGEVGYQVRFDERVSAATRIVAMTEGILLRRLQDDPFLDGIGAVLFDEFHERSLIADLTLGMVRRVQQTVRPDLKLVVMSATLAAEPIAAYLDGCPIIESAGRLFPVTVEYASQFENQPLATRVARGVEALIERTPGDVLVFLPGLREIREAGRALESLAESARLRVLELYGDLPPEQQDTVLRRADTRKVVLSTNVAETSVTIEGVTGVVDSGLARTLRIDPGIGLDRLELGPISKASADQRAGRAGRLAPGVCLRLWSEVSHRLRPDFDEPEIRRVDLSGAVLQLLAWGEADPLAFPWFEAPRETSVSQSLRLLERLGAMAGPDVTPCGHDMARLPLSPRLGRLLLEARDRQVLGRAALAAALLSERDPFLRNDTGPRSAGRTARVSRSDLLDRVEALEAFESNGATISDRGPLHVGGARQILRARDQLLRSIQNAGDASAVRRGSDEAFLRAVVAAFPDRVARRREPGSRRGVMVGGRGVRLAESSSVLDSDLFLAVDLDATGPEALVRQASAIEREWLPAGALRTVVEVVFEPATERVTARRRVWFEDLLLDESPAAAAPSDAEPLLAEKAADQLDRVVPWDNPDVAGFINRVRALRSWRPELELPDFNEIALRSVLPDACAGCRSFDDLRRAPWLMFLKNLLTPVQRAAVEREAPERIEVPSGSRIALVYETGRSSVLAVRIQEVFGWHETPRIAGGRIPVLLHLLAPNMRPQQITDDLKSFWANGYPVVRKELRRRYPKHAWPEDPWNALPQSRPTRRKT